MRLRSACKSEVYNVMFAVFAVGAGLSRRQQSVLSGAEKLRSACATSRARPHDGVGFRTFSRSRLFFPACSCTLPMHPFWKRTKKYSAYLARAVWCIVQGYSFPRSAQAGFSAPSCSNRVLARLVFTRTRQRRILQRETQIFLGWM